MGQDKTTQVSSVRIHVLAMNASLNTSDIQPYIPTNKSQYTIYKHTVHHGYVMTLRMILSP